LPELRNFHRVLSGLDVRPLLKQIYVEGARDPKFWTKDQSWTGADRETVLSGHENVVLNEPRKITAFNPHPEQYAFTLLSEAAPIIEKLMTAVKGVQLGRVMISRMEPGECVEPHADVTMMTEHMSPFMPNYDPTKIKRTPVPPVYQRYQIPIHGDDARFFCGEEELVMRPGEAWWFANTLSHHVENGIGVRIALIADIRSLRLMPR
jgi:hypothetical protein